MKKKKKKKNQKRETTYKATYKLIILKPVYNEE